MSTTRKTMFSFLAAALIALAVSFVLVNCGGGGGGNGGTSTTYTITYDGNGNDGGTVPTDAANYELGQIVTVPGNSGILVKAGYFFSGWNRQVDGNGTNYSQGEAFVMGVSNVILYAKWTVNPTYTVVYDGNGSTSGIVPTDTTNYEQGQTVMVSGNTGTLARTAYTFAGWNTSSNGTGSTYTQAQTFMMGSANVTLYAKWTISPTYTVTYSGNGLFICTYLGTCVFTPPASGGVPVDSTNYLQGQTVTVLGNTGNLVETGYYFAGWNTEWGGTGTTYWAGQTFPVGSADVTLYAWWLDPTIIFTNNGNDTMTDNRTGLIWKKSSDNSYLYTWATAKSLCGGYNFRLPTRDELQGVISGFTGGNPSSWLNSQGFTSVWAASYWSSTEMPYNPGWAYTIDMSNGSMSSGAEIDTRYFWCVHTGP